MTASRSRWGLALALLVALGACDDYEPQVIEQTEFAASLGVNLTTMTRLDSGVYIEDRVVGVGEELTVDGVATANYTLWLADGTLIDSSTDFEFDFSGEPALLTGFAIGVLGMRVGGTRLLLVPPELGFGDRDSGAIPAGSILVFEVELTAVS